MPDHQSAVRLAFEAVDRVCGQPTGTSRARQRGARFQHLVSTTEDIVGCHSIPGFIGTIAPSDPLLGRRVAMPCRAVGTPEARARNDADRSSKYLGRTLWRQLTGYHRRSRVETKMHCVKLLDQRLSARDFDRQVAEIQIRVATLNCFTALGIPETVTVG